VAALIGYGPSFDAEKAGLDRYHVFLTDREAVFLFEADAVDGLRKVVDAAKFSGAAAPWQDLAAGPPRLAEEALSWVRPRVDEYISSSPSPGPGDSEGGDVYPPEGPGRVKRERHDEAPRVGP
jgi:hypothetical protein